MSDEITLFDLPSRAGVCWSLNPWKTRAALNFKNLPYRTQWIEYPKLAPTFKAANLPPNPKGHLYTSPTVRMPDGTWIMESRKIADALEELQPEPSLHLDDSPIERTQAAVTKMFVFPVLAPRVPLKLLNPVSAAYFERTRAEKAGMPLAELARDEDKLKAAWEEAEEGVRESSQILAEHREGPFVLGNVPSYPDMILAGFWRFVELLDEGGDVFGRYMRADPAFERHYEASKKWLERDT